MIKSIQVLSEGSIKHCDFTKIHNHKVVIDHEAFIGQSFTIRITFDTTIYSFRNHDYRWVNTEESRIANWYSPKLLKLNTNQLVQANQNVGIWEINPKRKDVLLWHFNPENAKPITNYDENNGTHIKQAICNAKFEEALALLFPVGNGIEISRSKLNFSAIVCFTDHCDFDTLNNLIHQRQFFNKHQIKITKGFFLNHYSKRKDTACFEFHKEEFDKWRDDGHELAYHSLSQSVKPKSEAFEDFLAFEPPYNDISTWIDHGFQPYNFTLSGCESEIKNNYGTILKNRNINLLWNYIDSGTAVNQVINQVNPKQFTLKNYYDGIKHLGTKSVVRLVIKNIIFHYFNDNKGLYLYKQIARYLKTLKKKKSNIKHIRFIKHLFKLNMLLLPVVLLWRFKRHKVYPLAKFGPLFFDHEVDGITFTVFQTIEMINFNQALHKNNIDKLIEEHGVFIAHTYFSAPLNYHEGRLFYKNDEVDSEVDRKFSYLSEKVKSKDIWNPTLKELVSYMKQLKKVMYDCNEKGELILIKSKTLVSREVI